MEEEEEGRSEAMQLLNAYNDYGTVVNNGEAGDSSATLMLVFSTFVAVCGTFESGCITGYSSPAESGIRADVGLSTAEYAVFCSILTVGGVIGAATCGKAADLLGRKGNMWVADIFFSMGWLSIAFGNSAFWLYIGRLLSGIGFGLIGYAVPVYIAEITPKNLRGAYSTSAQFVLCIGFSMIYFLGTLISWRHLALVGSCGGFVQMVGLFFIPESPRWLAQTGRGDFESSLQRLRGKKADVSQEATEIREYTETFERISKPSVFSLFQRRYAHALTVGIGVMVLQQFSGQTAIAYYANDIFELAGFSTTVGSDGVALIQIPATLIGVFLMDKSGRRPLLMVAAGGMCFSGIIVGLSFLLQDYQLGTEITPILMFIGLLLYTVTFAIGMGGIPWLIMSEIFPVNLKASAGTIVSLTNWICSWAVTYSFSFLFDWSSAGTFFIFAATCGFTVLFVAKLMPETKLRQIEEIQASMNHFT